ncbi:MAG: lyase family protein, partial [Rikenellaceae bacterium]
MLNALTAISPIDGRYRRVTESLGDYFSESALIKYRIRVEVEYFIALCQIPLPELESFPQEKFADLRSLYLDFKYEDAQRVKEIESVTNHDVKAIEYIIKEKMDAMGLEAYKEFIHFGLTSQDINNTSVPLSIKEAIIDILTPALEELLSTLRGMASDWANISLLARTHGQPASPTKLGKEIQVYVERLTKQIEMMKQIPMAAKFGGATGNFNAHNIAYPAINWVDFANAFVEGGLGLSRSQYTTQIEHYDMLAALFDALKRIDTIMIDLARDF